MEVKSLESNMKDKVPKPFDGQFEGCMLRIPQLPSLKYLRKYLEKIFAFKEIFRICPSMIRNKIN